MNTTDFASLNSFVSLNKWKKIDRFSGAMLNMTHRLFFCSHRNYIHSFSHESSNFYLFFYLFPLSSIWPPAGASTIEPFEQLISSIKLHRIAAGPSAEDSGSDFTDIFHTSRWCYQSDMAVISADLMLMRKMPCNRSAAAALYFLRM